MQMGRIKAAGLHRHALHVLIKPPVLEIRDCSVEVLTVKTSVKSQENVKPSLRGLLMWRQDVREMGDIRKAHINKAHIKASSISIRG